MTGSEILNIVVTVGVVQLIIDLLSNRFVFKGDNYQRAIRSLERAQSKLDRAEADLKKNENKHKKRHASAKAEYEEAAADVARRHMAPSIFSGLFFVLLLRILGAEYKGKVIGVLPFVPYNLVNRITARGLDWKDVVPEVDLVGTQLGHKQALSFLCIYTLASLTVKFYVHKAVGIAPPKGADQGIMTVAESPMGRRVLDSFGVDLDELKKME